MSNEPSDAVCALVQENLHRAAALIHEAAMVGIAEAPPGITDGERTMLISRFCLIASQKAMALEILARMERAK